MNEEHVVEVRWRSWRATVLEWKDKEPRYVQALGIYEIEPTVKYLKQPHFLECTSPCQKVLPACNIQDGVDYFDARDAARVRSGSPKSATYKPLIFVDDVFTGQLSRKIVREGCCEQSRRA